jgi:hypothetical protein
MRTFQLRLIGETDGVVYSVKEYEASNEAHAAEVACGLCGDEPELWWGGQRLLKELVAAANADTTGCFV